MLNVNDCLAIEGENESEEDYYLAIQRAINSGSAWSFQGSYGRAMMDAIECGACCLGRTSARDYYGNYIPSRDEVQSGTKGSLAFVADRMGQEWADMIDQES